MAVVFPELVLRLVIHHCAPCIPTLKAVVLSSRLLRDLGRQVVFQYLRLPVREDNFADVHRLFDDKPYLLSFLTRLRLRGRRRGGRYPTFDIIAVDRLLYRIRPCPQAVGFACFRWQSAGGGLRQQYPIAQLSVHQVEADGLQDCPADLLHAFPEQTTCSVSGLYLHAMSNFPHAHVGELGVLSMDVEMVEHWRRNGVDRLRVDRVAELRCRGVHFYHVEWIRNTVSRSWDLLTKLTLTLATPVISEVAWEQLDLQVCHRLEELTVDVELPPLDREAHISTVLYTVLESLPNHIQYIELRFRFPGRSRLIHYSVRPARLPWNLYAILLRNLMTVPKVVLCLIHEDPMIMWREEDVGSIRRTLTADGAMEIEFKARMTVDHDSQSRWWEDMDTL